MGTYGPLIPKSKNEVAVTENILKKTLFKKAQG
jgi:hypothetical protein